MKQTAQYVYSFNVFIHLYTLFNEGKTHLASIKQFSYIAISTVSEQHKIQKVRQYKYIQIV